MLDARSDNERIYGFCLTERGGCAFTTSGAKACDTRNGWFLDFEVGIMT